MSTQIKVIKPSIQLLPSHMNCVEKVAKMSRICYLSEASASPENDANLVKGCIKRGHTSVTEHGYMSVFLSSDMVNPADIGIPRVKNQMSAQIIWGQYDTPNKREYLEVYGDDEIYKRVEGANADPKVLPVVIGNFRAWSNTIDDCIAASLTENYSLGFAFFTSLTMKAHKEFPVMFEHLIARIKDALPKINKESPLFKELAKEGDEVLTLERVCELGDKFVVVVAQAPARYSLSAILRTDRSVTHEIVRHRKKTAYSQESQRWVNYGGKGIEVIHLAMDPVKYGKYVFKTVDGNENPTSRLGEDGFVPDNSRTYAKWLASCQRNADEYLDFISGENGDIYIEGDEGAENKSVGLPPETSREVLQNSMATTIGVTWTPSTFANLMYWRLEEHAYWPFRSMMGQMVVTALKNHHEFFENFPPNLIMTWIEWIRSAKSVTDDALLNDLIDEQKKRQTNIDLKRLEMEKKLREAMEAHMKQVADQQKKAGETAAAPAPEMKVVEPEKKD